MSIEGHWHQSVATVTSEEPIREAGQRMESAGVGLLAVVDDGRLTGVLTDRDIVLHAATARESRVADAMSSPPVRIAAAASIGEAVGLMARSGMRRLLVVDAEDRPCGVLSSDDLIRLLGREIAALASVADAQIGPGADAAAADAGGESTAETPALRPFEHYQRQVVRVRPDTRVQQVIEGMRQGAVGCVVVTDEDDQPVGVVTDRDVALRVIARGEDPDQIEVSSVMSTPVVCCEATQPLDQLAATMRARAIRRMPVTQGGRLVGLVSFDDLVVLLGDELDRLGNAIRHDLRRESHAVRAEERRAQARARLSEAGETVGHLGEQIGRRLKQEIESLRERLRGLKQGWSDDD